MVAACFPRIHDRATAPRMIGLTAAEHPNSKNSWIHLLNKVYSFSVTKCFVRFVGLCTFCAIARYSAAVRALKRTSLGSEDCPIRIFVWLPCQIIACVRVQQFCAKYEVSCLTAQRSRSWIPKDTLLNVLVSAGHCTGAADEGPVSIRSHIETMPRLRSKREAKYLRGYGCYKRGQPVDQTPRS